MSLKASVRSIANGPNKRGGRSILALAIATSILALISLLTIVTLRSGSSGQVVSASVTKYNLLQAKSERTKAILQKAMHNRRNIPRYFDKEGISKTARITSAEILLIGDPINNILDEEVNGFLSKEELEKYGIASSGRVDVRIYDMRYDPELVPHDVGIGPDKITPEDLELLPASMFVSGEDDPASGDNTGIYLIRAILSLDRGNNGFRDISILESAVIQANNSSDHSSVPNVGENDNVLIYWRFGQPNSHNS